MTPVAFARPFAYRARPYDSRVHAARTRAGESAGRSRRYIKKIISSERRLADRRIFQPGRRGGRISEEKEIPPPGIFSFRVDSSADAASVGPH